MKRAISIAITITIMLAAPALVPSHAAAAPAGKVILKDPLGDGNFVNDQGTGDGSFGDFNQAGVGTVSDLLSVTLSNDAKNLYVTFQTQAAPPAATGVGYRVRFNPTATPGTQCILIEAMFPGANNDLSEFKAQLRNTCTGGPVVPLKIIGTQITVPRKADKAFAPGAKLTAPQAQSFQYSGSSYPAGTMAPIIDTTKVGTDYKLVH